MELKTVKFAKTNYINRVRFAKQSGFRFADASAVPSNALLNEDGTPLLTEDGQYILVE